jgi:phosphocarrier protein HPr
MTGQDVERRIVTIKSPHGLHMRPAQGFVAATSQYDCEVTVSKGNQRVNGKSLLMLLGLVALQGTELLLEVSGPDAARAIDPLAEELARVYPDD